MDDIIFLIAVISYIWKVEMSSAKHVEIAVADLTRTRIHEQIRRREYSKGSFKNRLANFFKTKVSSCEKYVVLADLTQECRCKSISLISYQLLGVGY